MDRKKIYLTLEEYERNIIFTALNEMRNAMKTMGMEKGITIIKGNNCLSCLNRKSINQIKTSSNGIMIMSILDNQ